MANEAWWANSGWGATNEKALSLINATGSSNKSSQKALKMKEATPRPRLNLMRPRPLAARLVSRGGGVTRPESLCPQSESLGVPDASLQHRPPCPREVEQTCQKVHNLKTRCYGRGGDYLSAQGPYFHLGASS